MISDPPTFVLMGLGIALVALFAVGFYWLATKDRPTRRHAPVAPPPNPSAADPRSADVDEFDEFDEWGRSRRTPITLSTPHMKPAPTRSIAIRRSASAKRPPSHPLRLMLAMACTTRSNR